MKLIFFTCMFFLLFSCKEKHETTYPTKSTLTESVYSSLIVQPDSLYQVYAIVGGILDKNLVEEGDTVITGTALVQIINTGPKLNTDNAKLALQLSQQNYSGNFTVLVALEDDIKSATLSFKNDSINYQRQKKLWEQQIGSKVQLENKQLAYELSKNNLQLLKSKYASTKNELLTKLQQAQNTYKVSQISTKDFTVSSKINGRVYAVYKNPGEIVNTLEPLAAIGSANNFIIEMLVDEIDIVKLTKGQKTLITLEAYGTQVFEAEISKIYPRKDERSQTFKVEALFKNPPKKLFPGLAGEGNIILSEKQNALTISKEYIINGDQVLTNDGLVTVVIGLQNLNQIEILSGISDKTKILKPKE